MWTRAELKARAKNVLRVIYWEAFIVGIIILVAGGMDSGYGGGGGAGASRQYKSKMGSNPDFLWSPDMFIILGVVAGAILIMAVLFIAFRVFLGYTLEVGGKRFFVKSAQFEDRSASFAFSFRKENYKEIILTMLVKDVYNFLWFMLLIIPGIIKAYAYRMVPYILTDNPQIGYSRAIELSNEMTKGHKFDMFVLDLSFIGWYILGLIALGVGVLFVMPYELATKAELYLVLRKNAMDYGMCTAGELSLAVE